MAKDTLITRQLGDNITRFEVGEKAVLLEAGEAYSTLRWPTELPPQDVIQALAETVGPTIHELWTIAPNGYTVRPYETQLSVSLYDAQRAVESRRGSLGMVRLSGLAESVGHISFEYTVNEPNPVATTGGIALVTTMLTDPGVEAMFSQTATPEVAGYFHDIIDTVAADSR